MVLIFGALAFSSFQYKGDRSDSVVGDVKYSILPPEQFKKVNGNDWVLADGRTINGSRLQKQFGINKVPDARGVFIRGLNMNRNDGLADPYKQETQSERLAGQYQADKVGPHSHGWTGEASYLGGYGYPDNAEQRWTADGLKKDPKFEKDRYVAAAQKDYSVSGVGSETRPKNIALYIYIKIN